MVGVMVGLFAWPLVAAIAGTGPTGPCGPVGSPLGMVEQWCVWLISVTDTGRQQARLLGQRLSNAPIDVVWHSPLPRAAASAQELATQPA